MRPPQLVGCSTGLRDPVIWGGSCGEVIVDIGQVPAALALGHHVGLLVWPKVIDADAEPVAPTAPARVARFAVYGAPVPLVVRLLVVA